MGERCNDCGKPVGTERDMSCCKDGCDGCEACRAFCWRLFHADVCQLPRKRRLIGWRVRYEGRLSGTWRANKAWLTDYDSAWAMARDLKQQPSMYRRVKVMRVYRRAK